MSGTFGMVLMICSPFIGAGVILGILKGIELWNRRRYERAIAKRNARLERLSITPFRGVKAYDDQH
jgi:hypothetical protein